MADLQFIGLRRGALRDCRKITAASSLGKNREMQ